LYAPVTSTMLLQPILPGRLPKARLASAASMKLSPSNGTSEGVGAPWAMVRPISRSQRPMSTWSREKSPVVAANLPTRFWLASTPLQAPVSV
jgi:hypothetical protein